MTNDQISFHLVIPCWIDGEWNPTADPQCHKCMMGQPHQATWSNRKKKLTIYHDDKAKPYTQDSR